MHWFWRATIAVLAGWAMRLSFKFALDFLFKSGIRGGVFTATVILSICLDLATAILVYGLLTWRYYAMQPRNSETRCRKCGYILRGISEPRCPECGERI